MSLLAATHTVSTLMMAGIIWFVQSVHYPLFTCVGEHEFDRFEKQHVRRTTRITAPLMITEATTAIGLVLLTWGYGPSIRTDARACPFTTFYWDFLIQNRKRFQSNQRISMMLRNVDRMTIDKRSAISDKAKRRRREFGIRGRVASGSR